MRASELMAVNPAKTLGLYDEDIPVHPAEWERDEATSSRSLQAWGGYPFADDGYEWMAKATEAPAEGVAGLVVAMVADAQQPMAAAGLRPWHQVGDWPYIVALRDRAERTIAIYIEGDVTFTVYDSDQAYAAGCAQVAKEHPAPCPSPSCRPRRSLTSCATW